MMDSDKQSRVTGEMHAPRPFFQHGSKQALFRAVARSVKTTDAAASLGFCPTEACRRHRSQCS